ncbi:ShlB/FhaC/HecB family hemolysin secretion/activation protein [Acinetobacter sp. KS-LM10]|uniref:ShlB/FhaC/HecB family hemolysin secretion/activation protein n=1 Tax=Acinetobacter sp. KS-LM10 TaxID=3120518 RepID=UPI00403F8795
MQKLKLKKLYLAMFLTITGNAIAAELQNFDTDQQLRQQQLVADQQIRQQQRDQALEKQIQPVPSVQTGLEEKLQTQPQLQYLKSNSEDICFDVKKFILIGEDARRFTFALSSVTQGKHNIIGRCIGVQGLNQALDLIQNSIISRGFVTTRMLLPQQNIASGEIKLQVIAGKVDQIQFTPGTSKRARLFNALPIKSGDILNIRDIEQGLENYKRVPTVEADFKIKPSELQNAPGYSDLELSWQQSRPYRIHLGVDDAGSDSTGKYQGTATLSLDNLLTVNDLFYASYNHDLGGGDSGNRGTDGFYLSYSIPLKYWLLTSSYSQSDYNQTVAGSIESYQYSGKSKLIGADLSRVLYRDAHRKTTASVGGWYRESQNFIDDTEVEVQRRKTAGWKTSIDHTEFLSNATLNGNLTYRRGTGGLSSLRAPEEDFGEAYTRVGIFQANASLKVPFKVGLQSLQYLTEWRSQYTKKPLTAQDRFSIGNRYTVRGYDGDQTLLADNGFLVRNELSGSIAKLPMQWYAGIDYGEVGGQTAHTPNPLVGTSLLGSAIGLRGQVLKSVSYDVFVGAPLHKPDRYRTDDLTTGFSVNWMY